MPTRATRGARIRRATSAGGCCGRNKCLLNHDSIPMSRFTVTTGQLRRWLQRAFLRLRGTGRLGPWLWGLVLAVVFKAALLTPLPAQAQSIYFTRTDEFKAVIEINLSTGKTVTISQNGSCCERGSGPAFRTLKGLDVASDGTIYVIAGSEVIYKVDSSTGDRTIVSGLGVGSGPAFDGLQDLEIGPGGDLFATDLDPREVFRIDPETGLRQTITGPSDGSGPIWRCCNRGLATDGTSLFVTGTEGFGFDEVEKIYKVDLSGNREVVATQDEEQDLVNKNDGITWNNGALFAMGRDGRIVRVNPETGDVELVASFPSLQDDTRDLAVNNGTAYVTDEDA